MILGVNELSGGELLHLVEGAIELANGLLNVVPGLIEILAERSGQVDSVLSELAVDLSEGLMHGIELLVSLLQSLELVSGVNKDAVSLIGVHVNVDIGSWNSLQASVWAVTENV